MRPKGGRRILNETANTPVIVSRFAPSPTGYLHLGHVHSALLAAGAAHSADGRFLLRIEDIDQGRCRSEFTDSIFEDLSWLGLSWEEPVRIQSEHFDDYTRYLEILTSKGLIYPCFCTRKEIAEEINQAGQAPHGPDGFIYPGTCRSMSDPERRRRISEGIPHALRLDMTMAVSQTGDLRWHDVALGEQATTAQIFGDIVLARKDTPASYHLAVTVDDHLQGVTRVVRGQDLFDATHVHRLLQALLGFSTPSYHHHPLLTDETGRRFTKRDQSMTIRSLRQEGRTRAEVRDMTSAAAKKAADGATIG